MRFGCVRAINSWGKPHLFGSPAGNEAALFVYKFYARQPIQVITLFMEARLHLALSGVTRAYPAEHPTFTLGSRQSAQKPLPRKCRHLFQIQQSQKINGLKLPV